MPTSGCMSSQNTAHSSHRTRCHGVVRLTYGELFRVFYSRHGDEGERMETGEMTELKGKCKKILRE